MTKKTCNYCEVWVTNQRPQPPIFCSDICAKSESNPKCLSKSLDKKPQKARIRDKNPICNKARVFVQLQLGFVQLQFGQVTILKIPATTYFAFNVVEFARLQSMFSAFYWRNGTCQPFLTSNWHFWQMTQMSDKCLLSKTEKTQISGQTQIIWVGWGLCAGQWCCIQRD